MLCGHLRFGRKSWGRWGGPGYGPGPGPGPNPGPGPDRGPALDIGPAVPCHSLKLCVGCGCCASWWALLLREPVMAAPSPALFIPLEKSLGVCQQPASPFWGLCLSREAGRLELLAPCTVEAGITWLREGTWRGGCMSLWLSWSR